MPATAPLHPDTVARLMERLRRRDHAAAGRLVEFFYAERWRIAVPRMRVERVAGTPGL